MPAIRSKRLEKRCLKLRKFMETHDITYRSIGEQLGLSEQRAFAMMRQKTYLQDHHDKLIALGFPPDALPEPVPEPKMRKRPHFPGLQKQQQPATYQAAG